MRPHQAGDQTLIVLHDERGDFPLVETMKAAHSQVLECRQNSGILRSGAKIERLR